MDRFAPNAPAYPKLEITTAAKLEELSQVRALTEAQRFEMRVVSSVLPFRVNSYVVNELIDWTRVPEDPMFRLLFPQKGMLEPEDYAGLADLHRSGASKSEIREAAAAVRARLNPHPGGQLELNVPRLEGEPVEGLQHKYRETVLFFPAAGQTCHSYCTFCFRWAQFIGDADLRMANKDAAMLHGYLKEHQEVTDLLVTGGDPMVMKTSKLAEYIEPLLEPRFDHIRNLRIGSKSLTFWPQRFVSDPDAAEALDLFRRVVASGKHLAFMAHYEHPAELSTGVAHEAIRRLRETGVTIRTQAPLLRHINDDPAIWAELWREQVRLGMVPYYMFVERDTGSRAYFELPLVEAHAIYRDALAQVGGLARTARGPVMSARHGKVEVTGPAMVAGRRVLALRFLQARNPDWVGRPFFAEYDENATWLDGLRPAFGEKRFFYEQELAELEGRADARLASLTSR